MGGWFDRRQAKERRQMTLFQAIFILAGVFALGIFFSHPKRNQPGQLEESLSAARRPPQAASTAAADAAIVKRAHRVLTSGDGNDWLGLSDREKLTLCLGAAGLMKHGGQEKQDVALTYLEFVEQFYSHANPITRAQSVNETIAVCEVLIQQGTISSD